VFLRASPYLCVNFWRILNFILVLYKYFDKKRVRKERLSNAIKFTREGGQIILEGQASLQTWQLAVQDTGVGMSQEKLQTLFGSPQINSTKGVRGEKGIGIGLQLCYELSQSIGATLTVQSVEDKGTVFRLVCSSD
jgi:signal transduction histidine kinase